MIVYRYMKSSKIKKELMEAEKDRERGRITLYLNYDLYERFKKACNPIAASKVVERLMKEFIESK